MPRVNPNVNCALWVIMMCPCRFLDHKNGPLWCGMLVVREVCVCANKGCVGTLSQPTPALKSKVCF